MLLSVKKIVSIQGEPLLMADDEIEKLYQRCLAYGLSVEEAVQQLVIAGVTSDDYLRWCNNRTVSDV